LIPGYEFREKARENGVPVSSIERDYAQNRLLDALSGKIKMALKGGTGIRKVYMEGYRFSDDLDFTLMEVYTQDEVNNVLGRALKNVKEQSGVSFLEDFKLQRVKNGFTASTYFRILRTSGNPLRIKLDLTAPSSEIILLEPWMREIIHPYSDKLRSEILSYRLEEVLSEKIRALFERTRPRDLYDVWRLKELGLEEPEIISRKFQFKEVSFDIVRLNRRRQYFEQAWVNSLRHQLRELPDFTSVYTDTLDYLQSILKNIREI
jgi:predicted nucleotidyltransferase component of viral defense system